MMMSEVRSSDYISIIYHYYSCSK